MSHNSGRRNGLIAAGVTLAALAGSGLAGYFLYSELSKRKNAVLNRLELPMLELHEELQALRNEGLTVDFYAESSATTEYYTCRSEVDSEEDFESCVEFLEDEKCTSKYEDVFEKADMLMKEGDESVKKAYNLLKNNEGEMSKSANFLWRLAKAHCLLLDNTDNEGAKKKYIVEGLKYAEDALELDCKNVECHKWFAVLCGLKGEHSFLPEKLRSGELFYKHVLEALKLSPKDSYLHFLLARFKFELANLDFFERIALNTLSIQFPQVKFEDVLEDLEMAKKYSLEPSKELELLFAKCYRAMGKNTHAVAMLRQARNIKSKNKKERELDRDIDASLGE